MEFRNGHDWTAFARKWCGIFLVTGIVWRMIRFGLGFPIWGDEAGLSLNIAMGHSFAELCRPLDNYQVAPLGFLAAQFAVVRCWGTSEYAMRLVPLLTGIVAVLLFVRLAWLALPPLGAACATGLLAASFFATRYSVEAKPYGTDLMASALLLGLGVSWQRASIARWRWTAALIVAAPVMIGFSFPAIFVAGAVGAGMLPAVWRERTRGSAWLEFLAYGLAIIAAFAMVLKLSAAEQYQSSQASMLVYWVRGLPPGDPLRFLLWLIDVHTAEVMCYPVSAKNGGGAPTFAMCIVGAIYLHRQRKGPLLLMLAAPFALTFIAAVLRRYPYGGSGRVAQHLGPAICLLAGAGVAGLVQTIASPLAARKTAAVIMTILFLMAVGGAIRDVLHPYQTSFDREVQLMFNAWGRDRQLDSGIWFLDDRKDVPWNVRWYICRAVGWDESQMIFGATPPAILPPHTQWWVVNSSARRDTGSLALPGYQRGRVQTITNPKFTIDQFGKVVELEEWRRE